MAQQLKSNYTKILTGIVLISLICIGYYNFAVHFDIIGIYVSDRDCVTSKNNCYAAKDGNVSVKWSFKNLLRRIGFGNAERETDNSISQTELEDLYFAIKTSNKFHKTRIKDLVETWITIVPNQTYIFTDAEDKDISSRLPKGHFINTKCPRSYHPSALACKMAHEIQHFSKTKKRWFIHVDDDNYINIKRLVQTLRQFNDSLPWYIGNPSLPYKKALTKKIKFWFATTGAGVCLSRPLVEMMNSTMGKGGFVGVANRIGAPDDVTLGYIINYLLKVNLTVIHSFRFHYQKLAKIQHPLNQTILSYSKNNTVTIDGFSLKEDPSRYKSVHCHLFPQQEYCAKMHKQKPNGTS